MLNTKKIKREILGQLTPDKIDKYLSEEAFQKLRGYFEDGILKITDTQKEATDAQIKIMRETGIESLEELNRIGRKIIEEEEKREESLKMVWPL